jgi:C-terminal processing protease CtpA/Prc
MEDGVENRKARLTVASTLLGDALMSKDGEKLYYLAKGEKGFDVWETNLRTHETKVLQKLGAEGAGMEMDKEGKRLFIFADGRISKITLAENKLEPIAYNTEIRLNPAAERAYMYEHVWRQVTKKFYVKDLHGVDWTFYKTAYAKFLPHIGNGFEFAELLGELNASHTGGYYTPAAPNGDQTASLGVFYDETYRGKGMKIAEIMEKSPLVQAGMKIKAGTIIEKIDGEEILENTSIYTLLNRKAGKNTLLSLSENGNRWEEVVKPVSLGAETELRYQRWVKHEREMVEKRSNGRIGYVHVRGMDNESFRTVYEDALGRHANKAALVVDTRFNGGGWLHDDLATFLNNKPYLKMEPRGQDLGTEPRFRWHRPSAVLMNESNYSDAHMFPYVYKALAIGKLVGMPVAGTATAVWWENLIDPTIRFGIPQVGMRSNDGYLLENTQLEPDIKVFNEPKPLRNGEDQQINAVVDDLLKGIGKK